MKPRSPLERLVQHSRGPQRVREADVNFRTTRRALGPRYCTFTTRPGGVEFVASWRRTHKPGSKIPMGSHTRLSSEFALTDPPPGQRGSFEPIILGTVLGQGTGCDETFGGFVGFERVFFDGVEQPLGSNGHPTVDTIDLPPNVGIDVVNSCEMVPFTCVPSPVGAFAEERLSGDADTFGDPDGTWLIRRVLVLSNGNLHVEFSCMSAFVNPSGDQYEADFRLWHPELGHLQWYSGFSTFNDGVLNRPRFEI